jgi:3-hydroxybutyryl-CoA dehydrogenase
MLVNEAAEALFLGIASADHLDLAMIKGVNYPKGLLAWGDEIGAKTVLMQLDNLYDEYKDDRYRASVLLRRRVAEGRKLLE